MSSVITGLASMTELEAVNGMLTAIGETPLDDGTDLSTATQPDIRMAIGVLRDVAREVLSIGWRFNTDFGVELAPAAQLTWADGIVLNVFTPPAGLAAFQVTQTVCQIGRKLVDTEIRPAKVYSENALVFYNRADARDGFTATEHPYLYLNITWYLDFEQMPQTARQYIAQRAARTFSEQSVGAPQLSSFATRNEALALRNLQKDQGNQDRIFYLTPNERYLARGQRGSYPQAYVDSRKNLGH